MMIFSSIDNVGKQTEKVSTSVLTYNMSLNFVSITSVINMMIESNWNEYLSSILIETDKVTIKIC